MKETGQLKSSLASLHTEINVCLSSTNSYKHPLFICENNNSFNHTLFLYCHNHNGEKDKSGNENEYALLFISDLILSKLACSNYELKLTDSKCLPFFTTTQWMYSLYFPPCSWSPTPCGLISYAGSSGSGQRGPHCRVAQQIPQGQALCSRSPGANPLPCLPASVHMSSYGRHMRSCRKADAVFPFVKSSFWKAVSTLMPRVESVRECKGERAVKRQQAQLYWGDC